MQQSLVLKVTIIWASQSGTNFGSNHRVRAPQAQAIGGPTWRSGGALWAPPVGSGAEPRPPAIFSYIQIKSELIFGHRCVSIRLQRWANRVKSGTPSKKWDKWASRVNLYFFPETSLKSGLSQKIRDGCSPYLYYNNKNGMKQEAPPLPTPSIHHVRYNGRCPDEFVSRWISSAICSTKRKWQRFTKDQPTTSKL